MPCRQWSVVSSSPRPHGMNWPCRARFSDRAINGQRKLVRFFKMTGLTTARPKHLVDRFGQDIHFERFLKKGVIAKFFRQDVRTIGGCENDRAPARLINSATGVISFPWRLTS